METINNSCRNFFKKLLEDYVEELKRNYNTTFDTKALDYLADKLTIKATKESNHKLLTTVENNITKIFVNGKIIVSSESVNNGLYENCFNITTKKDTKSKKPLDTNKVEKNKYYNSRYNYYYKQYKSNKIDELTFNRIKKELKRIRKECSNLKEFSDRFIAFEKEELKKG